MALPYCCEGSRWQGACVRTTIENIEPNLSNTINWGPEEDMQRLCVGSPCALEMAFRRINTCLSRKQLTPGEVSSVVTAARTQGTPIPAVGTVWRVVTVITRQSPSKSSPHRFYSLEFSEETSVVESRMSRLVKSIQPRLIVVRVKGESDFPHPGAVTHIIDNGLEVLGTKYSFLYASNSQVRDRTGVFFAEFTRVPQSLKFLLELLRPEGPFKALSRLGLLASTELSHVAIDAADYGEYPDVRGVNNCLLTDGVGLMDLDFALDRGILLPHQHAVQFRFQGCKGVLLAVRNLATTVPGVRHHIVFRPSQRKFDVPANRGLDEGLLAEMSILRRNEFGPACCNREAIQLLSANEDGAATVNARLRHLHHEFMWTLFEVLEDAGSFVQAAKAMTTLKGCFDMDAILIKFGSKMLLDPWWQGCLDTLWTHLAEKARYKFAFPIDEGAHLLGVADPFGVLQEGEVFISIRRDPDAAVEVIGGRDVVVYRNPCLHPGDIRRLKAVAPQGLVDAGFANLIIFPCRHDVTSIPEACSGGDLDGDDFTVIWDRALVNINPVEALDYTNLEGFYRMNDTATTGSAFEAVSNGVVGRISNMHTTICALEVDGANSEISKSLAKSQAVAVDSPKTGKEAMIPQQVQDTITHRGYPHYLKNKSNNKFHSPSLLGRLFDFAEAFAFKGEVSLGSDDVVEDAYRSEFDLDEEVAYWASKVQQAVRSAGLDKPHELFMGFSITDRFMKRADRAKVASILESLLVEFRDTFDGIEDQIAGAWFHAACRYDPRGDLGVRALAWTLADWLVPTTSQSELERELARQIRQFAEVPPGEAPCSFSKPPFCAAFPHDAVSSHCLATAIYRLVISAHACQSRLAPDPSLVCTLKDTILDCLSTTPRGVDNVELFVTRRVVNELIRRRQLGGVAQRVLIGLQHSLALSRNLSIYQNPTAQPRHAIPSDKPNVPRVVTLEGDEGSTFSLVGFHRDPRYSMLSKARPRVNPDNGIYDLSHICNEMQDISEGMVTNGHIRQFKVSFGFQLFGNFIVTPQQQATAVTADEVRRAIQKGQFAPPENRNGGGAPDNMAPLQPLRIPTNINKQTGLPQIIKARPKEPAPEVSPSMFATNLTRQDINRFTAALKAEGFTEVVDGRRQALRFTVFDDENDTRYSFDLDTAANSLVVVGAKDEVHLRSTVVMVGGTRTPPDARLKITSQILLDESENNAWRMSNLDLLAAEVVANGAFDGVRCGGLGRLRARTKQSHYTKNFGLGGGLAPLVLTATFATNVYYLPSAGSYRQTSVDSTFSLEVSCFGDNAPLTHEQCDEILSKTKEWVMRLQGYLPAYGPP